MAELITHALTTRDRVKNRLLITTAGHDDVIDRLISAATDIIESYCDRRFVETTYTDEVYSGQVGAYVYLNQSPVTTLTSLSYRGGTVSSPNWTAYIADNYELEGTSGLVRVYGGVPSGTNNIRATYTAGYKINFADPSDSAAHTLPHDLSDMCERLASRLFKRRDHEAEQSQTNEGNTIQWADVLKDEDKMILNKYKRLIFV